MIAIESGAILLHLSSASCLSRVLSQNLLKGFDGSATIRYELQKGVGIGLVGQQKDRNISLHNLSYQNMIVELLGRVQKELSVTSHAFYETVLAISELVNRKVQIIRLHWHASTLLKRIDEVAGRLGEQIVTQVSNRLVDNPSLDSGVGTIDETLTEAIAKVQHLKSLLARVDTHIRELKLEAIHQDLLAFQRDLTRRSGGIARLTVTRGATATSEPLSALPHSASAHIATVFRGPFLLAPTNDLLLRPGDIVILIGTQAELDTLTTWFTGQRTLTPSLTRSL